MRLPRRLTALRKSFALRRMGKKSLSIAFSKSCDCSCPIHGKAAHRPLSRQRTQPGYLRRSSGGHGPGRAAGVYRCGFETQGKRIPYRNVSILPAGLNFNETQAHLFVMRDAAAPGFTQKRSTPKRARNQAASAEFGRASTGAPGAPGTGIACLAIDRSQAEKNARVSHLW